MFDSKKAENIIGYTFKDKRLLKRAFTLSSASPRENNERLEFFGDAVLQFVVTEMLYSEGGSEGDMTARRQQIVSGEALEAVAKRMGLDGLLIRGRGDTHNHKAISSVYEAVAAAIYLDGGICAAAEFIRSTVDMSGEKSQINYKGKLQELLQGRGLPLPEYAKRELGNPQNPLFEATASVGGRSYTARGSSVKEAEQLAAKAAYLAHRNI